MSRLVTALTDIALAVAWLFAVVTGWGRHSPIGIQSNDTAYYPACVPYVHDPQAIFKSAQSSSIKDTLSGIEPSLCRSAYLRCL